MNSDGLKKKENDLPLDLTYKSNVVGPNAKGAELQCSAIKGEFRSNSIKAELHYPMETELQHDTMEEELQRIKYGLLPNVGCPVFAIPSFVSQYWIHNYDSSFPPIYPSPERSDVTSCGSSPNGVIPSPSFQEPTTSRYTPTSTSESFCVKKSRKRAATETSSRGKRACTNSVDLKFTPEQLADFIARNTTKDYVGEEQMSEKLGQLLLEHNFSLAEFENSMHIHRMELNEFMAYLAKRNANNKSAKKSRDKKKFLEAEKDNLISRCERIIKMYQRLADRNSNIPIPMELYTELRNIRPPYVMSPQLEAYSRMT